MRQPDPDTEVALLAEMREALTAWRISPEEWRLVGVTPGARGGLGRPVISTASGMWLLRRQAPEITLEDTRFRHALMSHLTLAGLPAPSLLPTPEGRTWALAHDGIYELQRYLPGEPFAADPSAARVESAALMLGRFHQASAGFAWEPYAWPDERSAPALASAYTDRIRQAATGVWAGSSVGRALERAAGSCEERLASAAHAMELTPAPPSLHIHGDYQPHNLAFADSSVTAIYDFDAARWEQRVYELAYALLNFTGLRWDEADTLTPPRVDDGLDILLARRFLAAYGEEAPPDEDEAPLLASALTLVFPIALANGAAEDLVFSEDFTDMASEEDALERLEWADRFWLWLERYSGTLAEAWQNG